MIWTLYRQHRVQAGAVLALLIAFVALVVPSGLGIQHTIEGALKVCSRDCSPQTFVSVSELVNSTIRASLAVPLVLGAFIGSALFAREFEQRTHVLAWTQGVTRGRWLASKIGYAIALTVLVSGAVSLVVGWWYDRQATGVGFTGRFDPFQYELRGLVPIGYGIFALGLGLAIGAVVRRTLPTLGATVLLWFLGRMSFGNYVREHLATPITVDGTSSRGNGATDGAWVTATQLFAPDGSVAQRFRVGAPCGQSIDFYTCLKQGGYREMVTYHPASRYWSFQWMEMGIFAAVGLLLAGFAYWWTQRRDA